MKKSYTFYSVLIFLILFSCGNLLADGFKSLYSINGGILWLVGSEGKIYRTSNGNSFVSHSFGTTNYNAVSGKGLYIFVGGDNGVILTSTNSGGNFTQSNIGSSDNVNAIYFKDENTGWAACNNGKIYYTTNAAGSWTLQTTPVSYNLNSMKFTDSLNAVVCGNNGTVLITTNGGVSWNQSVVPVTKDLLVIDKKGNTIMVSGVDATVLKSTNSGSSWISIDYNITTKPDIGGISLISSTTYYSCGVGGFIRKSTNLGSSFTYQESPYMMDLSYIYFYDSLKGWALSNNTNVVLRTINGGSTWLGPTGTVQTLSWDLKIPLVFYTSSGNVFYQSTWNKKEIFVTKSNTIYRSLNAGDNWSTVGNHTPYGMISNSFLVSSTDTNIFLIAIDSMDNIHGKVLRSTNYGQTWYETFAALRSSDGIPFAQDPNNLNTVYYGPDTTTLYRSTDFGITWSSVGTQRFGQVCAIKVLEGNSNVIIVGSADYVQGYDVSHVRRSTDYGATWTVVDSNVRKSGQPPEVPSIVGSKLSPILYSANFQGDFGAVKRSFDNGATWQNVNLDMDVWGLDVSRDDPNAFVYGIWASGIDEAGYITFDRGVHFEELPSTNNNGNFSIYFYNRNTLIFQQPLGYYKLHVTLTVPIGIQPISTEIPQTFALKQNYPNPFNPVTKIKFDLPKSGEVTLKIYDVLGKEVSELVNEHLNAGEYSVDWNAANYPSGVYFYKLQTDNYTGTKKMILTK